MSFRITGLDKLRRDLQQASEAFRALDGEIASVRFDPADLSSVEVAISEMEQAIDRRIAPFSDNELVRNMMTELKAKYRDQILERAANASSKREDDPVAETTIDQGMLRQIENTVTDLRRAEYNTFAQHIRKLSRLLHSPALEGINRGLTDGIDLEAWLTAGVATEGSMAGSARLEWPSDPEKELGTVVLLIDKFAGNPDEATGFARTFYYTGSSSLSGSLQNMVGQMIVPFTRDYIDHVKAKTGTVEATLLPERKAPAVRKAFVVHGHDEGVREAVARFLERIGFEAIILHERANQGRTIIEKIEAHGDVGFAVVLLTPDDFGGIQGGETHPRARQNVLLELGYFLGRLGRSRVCALKRGDVEIPSDFGGVVYETFDAGQAWKAILGRELQAAGFEIDWNNIMRP